ncbi:MAG: AAA family ATPase [Bacteroidota bacterium]
MIERTHYVQQVSNALQHFPACALLGPRQCGKTTLALELKKHFEQVHHFDLEDPLDFAQFDTPKMLLEKRKGLVIIDEIQRKPELFPYLRALLDRNPDLKLIAIGKRI